MGASITLAGENLIAQKQAANVGLKVVRFIFANVPGLDTSGPVNRAAGKPAAAQIVHSYQIPDENAGYVNPNQIVYSAQIGSDIGDWDFNWIGLETAENVLFAVAYVPVQQKRRNIPPLQIGNNLTRNFLVVFDGAQALTGITIDASTWQHDFTVRLAGIDERERLSNRDIFGRARFLNSALELEKVGSAYQLKPGIAYVEGIRIERSTAYPVVPPAFPTTAWLDVALQRELNDVVANFQVVFTAARPDYTDSAGVKHYCVAIADLPNSNTITDRRTVEPITGPLVEYFAPRAYVHDYVRAELEKLDGKQSVRVATTANIALTGLQTIDGIALVAGDRVLVKAQTNGAQNGIYTAAAAAWARSADADASLEATPGMLVPVEQGTTNADSIWQLVTDAPIELGSTGLVFEFVSGPSGVTAGTYRSVTVNKRGLVTGGTNPTTVDGYGITDALHTKGNAAGLDLNTLVTDGRYSGSGITNAPDAGFWYVDVQQHGSNGLYCRQTLWRITGGNTEQLQRHQNNGVWTTFIKAKTERGIFSTAVNLPLTVNHMGLINVDAAGGDRVITLPASDAALGILDVVLRRVDNSANKLTIQTAGTDKVKFHTHLNAAGYGFFYLMGAGDWWHLRSDGAGGWYVLGRLDSSPLGRPTFETTTAFQPGGNGPLGGILYNRSEWPWLWDHAQASGMLTTEAARAGKEGSWTAGDGAATFRGPDGRGEFIRVWDDSRGADPSRAAGSWQKGTAVGTDNDTAGGTEAISIGVTSGLNEGVGGDKYSLVSSYYPGLNIRATTLGSTPSVADTYVAITRPRNVAFPGRMKLI